MRNFYPLFLLLLLIFSCKSEDYTDNNENPTHPQSNFNFGNPVQRNFQGQVVETNGTPVSGATVTIGTNTVQTDSKGIFIFKNAQVKENFAYIKVAKSGYINASRTLVTTNGNNRVNIMMIPATSTSTIASGASSTVTLGNGTKVKFDGSFKDVNGNAYSGNVNVALFHLSPSDQYLNELMPGSFLATNSNGAARIMETYGMVHVQLTGSSGQNLQIANGHTAEITVPLDPAQIASSPNTIPLWAFNEETGIWQEEGSATKVGNTYVANVSHFSWWNCDAQFAQSILKVNVKNAAGQPVSNIKIGLKRNTQTYETFAYTDNNGTASGIVPANETLTMKVYDACNTVLSTTTVGPFTAGATTTLPDIILPNANTYTIQGTLKTCAGADVTDGFVTLKFAGSSNYFQTLTALVTNGSFTFNTAACSGNQQFVLEGYDITNLQTTGEINFTGVSPITNLGNMTVCTAVSEFITYQIDNQPVKYVLSGINASYVPGMPLTIGSQSTNTFFYLSAMMNPPAVGSYTTGFVLEFTGGNFSAGSPNNVTLQLNSFGAVGQYIDFTINGTYIDLAGSHTFTATGHVKRDN